MSNKREQLVAIAVEKRWMEVTNDMGLNTLILGGMNGLNGL